MKKIQYDKPFPFKVPQSYLKVEEGSSNKPTESSYSSQKASKKKAPIIILFIIAISTFFFLGRYVGQWSNHIEPSKNAASTNSDVSQNTISNNALSEPQENQTSSESIPSTVTEIVFDDKLEYSNAKSSMDETVSDKNDTPVVFKHGFDLDYPPYSYIEDDGNPGGFDVEAAQAVCDYYGWQYEAVPFNWDEKEAELNAKNCDCIWSGFTMEGREEDYLWSVPYADNTQLIMVKNDSGIEKLSDLAGKAVGVQASTYAYDLLNDEEGQKALADTFSTLQIYETNTIAFNDLKAGAIDAIAIDISSGKYLMTGETNYKFLDEKLGSERYAIGFRKDDTELCEKVNAALEALASDGTINKIAEQYPDIYDTLL